MKRHLVTSFALLALAGFGASTAGCLDPGPPPAGRQVVAGRDMGLLAALPSSPDGTLRLIVMRAGSGEGVGLDFYSLSVPADGSAPSERLLAERALIRFYGGPGCDPQALCIPTDARGRILLATEYDQMTGKSRFLRIDPTTGDTLDLGRADGLAISPDGQRLFVAAVDGAAAQLDVTLYEANDQTVTIAGANGAQFVGDTLFYITPDLQLGRVLPGGAPEVVRANVASFQLPLFEAGPRLILFLPTGDPNKVLQTVIDPVTLEEIFSPFPAANVLELSSDGRWLAASVFDGSGNQHFTLMEEGSGAGEDFDVPATLFAAQWRPGRSELWLTGGDGGYGSTTTWIKRPGTALVALPVVAGSRAYTMFNDDGTYWYSLEQGKAQGRTSMFVGPADDPTAPRVRLNPDGSDILDPRQLADGRFLVEPFYGSEERADITVVDPTTGEARVLGREGRVRVIGDRRIMARLRLNDFVGDLAVLDLDGGGSLRLGTEFVTNAVAERRAADRLAPGTRVAFQFEARFDSPYDGIWVVTLP